MFSKPGLLDRSAIPPDKASLFDAFDKLANSVTPYISLFADESLKSKRCLLILEYVQYAHLEFIRQTGFVSVVHWRFAATRSYKRTTS